VIFWALSSARAAAASVREAAAAACWLPVRPALMATMIAAMIPTVVAALATRADQLRCVHTRMVAAARCIQMTVRLTNPAVARPAGCESGRCIAGGPNRNDMRAGPAVTTWLRSRSKRGSAVHPQAAPAEIGSTHHRKPPPSRWPASVRMNSDRREHGRIRPRSKSVLLKAWPTSPGRVGGLRKQRAGLLAPQDSAGVSPLAGRVETLMEHNRQRLWRAGPILTRTASPARCFRAL
jgi:hypothetical protein